VLGVLMLSRRFLTLILSLSLAFSTIPFAHGQSTYGAITGSVSDPSGAAVPDAQVTLTNLGTSEKRAQPTGSDGLYTFVNVIPGNYRIEIEKQGFKHIVREPVVVQVQQNTRIDAVLQVGQVSEKIEVTAETPLLQSETSSLGQVIEERKANELPLNGRNIFNLITVSPAAVSQGGAGGTPVGQNPFSWGNYQVGGSFANEGAQYLDGQPLNIGYINLPIVIPTQDSVGEFKVQYNNLGAEWGKFAGGVVNLSTKSGSNSFHGEAYEYLRNKVLNSKGYFDKINPPYVQNQYGLNVGGPVIKNKTFFFTSWEQFRLRKGQTTTTTVPTALMRTGNFSELAFPIYDPFTVNQSTGARTAYTGNIITPGEMSPAAQALLKFLPPPTNGALTNNFSKATSTGGNNNQFVARADQNISDKSRLFGRFTYFGLLDLPNDPFGTGLCADRCAENYHTKAIAVDYNHAFTPNTIADFNISASRFVYLRTPINSAFDLTQLGWPASYNNLPKAMRTPPTPCFLGDSVGCSQGQSFISDDNTQFNFSPGVTMIRGRHTLQWGGQLEMGYDNYAQTNIASGAFAFGGSWTTNNALTPTTAGNPYADFLLGLSQNQGNFVNQFEGAAQVPAQTAGKQTYRALYFNDNWRATGKLTLNLGLRYELQGTWSERFDRISYFDPRATNGTVTGCSGVPGSPCTGDVFLVKTGVNHSRNNMPLDKKQFSPRLGFAYSWDQKTVIRGGYGIFFIPNYVSFGVNPDLDPMSLATTGFVATTNAGLTPAGTIDASGCTLAPGGSFTSFRTSCQFQGPFGSTGIQPPPGRTINPSVFTAGQGLGQVAPYTNPKYGYVQQWNLDLQRELPLGFFADVAYAGSKGTHLPQFSTQVNQISDSLISQAAQQFAAGQTTPTIAQAPAGCTGKPGDPTSPTPNPCNPFAGITSGAFAPKITISQGQLDRPFPSYNGLALAGYGCCASTYNSLQVSVQRRFTSGGTLLVAYTNAKLISNTDTLTSWLEGDTGGVGQIQDWNNLRHERSLSSQDVPQRLVISYVLDLPFGRGKKFLGGVSGVTSKAVSGWGIDGVTTFQRGFPLKIAYGGSSALKSASLGVQNLRPDVVPGCHTGMSGSAESKLGEWFNTACFVAPGPWSFGDEARVDPSLRMKGVSNFDFALFKRTMITESAGLEFRTEFFNLFNHPQFGPPNTSLGASTFGVVNSQVNNPRLIQFALKFLF
jgi:hypothetical protein